VKVLTLNCGSSSIKYALFEDEKLLWKKEAKKLSELKDLPEEPIDAIGHRIVHGGKEFTQSVLITDEVLKKLKKLCDLAPLHMELELEGIKKLQKVYRKAKHVAVFDTAFHRTLPEKAKVFPGPYSWFEEGIERFGFHGMSFQYCAKKAVEILGKDGKMVICHLGSGASLCSVKEGKSIDTTMGMTPLDGLMMDTRSGSLDPGVLLYLLEKKMSLKELTKVLYEGSGLLGVSGISGDMREILAKKDSEKRAGLAWDVYLHRLCSCIGSMMTSLQGMDALVFTGGIGENAALLRKCVCEHFGFLGVKLDETKEDGVLSAPDSKISVLLIHTNEELEIAREARAHS